MESLITPYTACAIGMAVFILTRLGGEIRGLIDGVMAELPVSSQMYGSLMPMLVMVCSVAFLFFAMVLGALWPLCMAGLIYDRINEGSHTE